jgi:hypothetical protein
MRKLYPPKSPAEVLKYGFNWSPRNIGTERITIANATVVTGTCTVLQTAVADVPGARDGQGTIYTISGGADGEVCELFLEARTDAGSDLEATVFLPIRQK